MSWVTDVLLCANLLEKFDEDLKPQKSCAAIDEINAWLREQDVGTLADLSVHMETGGKAAQALVYGGSFNHLEVEEFKKLVLSRNWQMPKSVRLLLNDEEDEGFSVFIPEA